MSSMETVPAHWYDDKVALSAALAELDWPTEDDLLTDGDLLGVTDAQGEVLPVETSLIDWSVQETLARVAASPPGPQPIRWLTSLDGRTLNQVEALELAG